MSYILEALKKAQAERQLGSAPTIHAPVVHAAPAAAARRGPLLVGVGAGAVLAVAAAIVAWRHQTPAPAVLASAPPATGNAAPVPQAGVPVTSISGAAPRSSVANQQVNPTAALPSSSPAARTPASVAGAPVAAAGAPAAPSPAAVASTHTAPAPAPLESTPAAAQASVASKPAMAVRAPVADKPGRPAQAPVASVPAPASPMPAGRAPAPVPVVEKPAAPAAEASLRTLAELPEAIQREVPHVTFGGYIYSTNPADRLLLVDKALRHEGEEVAPGLVLEKLLPKAAVMNFRGYRYRVAY